MLFDIPCIPFLYTINVYIERKFLSLFFHTLQFIVIFITHTYTHTTIL